MIAVLTEDGERIRRSNRTKRLRSFVPHHAVLILAAHGIAQRDEGGDAEEEEDEETLVSSRRRPLTKAGV